MKSILGVLGSFGAAYRALLRHMNHEWPEEAARFQSTQLEQLPSDVVYWHMPNDVTYRCTRVAYSSLEVLRLAQKFCDSERPHMNRAWRCLLLGRLATLLQILGEFQDLLKSPTRVERPAVQQFLASVKQPRPDPEPEVEPSNELAEIARKLHINALVVPAAAGFEVFVAPSEQSRMIAALQEHGITGWAVKPAVIELQKKEDSDGLEPPQTD